MMTLLQTGKIARQDVKVILYGEEYWRRVLDFEALVAAGAISPRDARLFRFFSDPDKAFGYLKKELGKLCDGDVPPGLPSGLR